MDFDEAVEAVEGARPAISRHACRTVRRRESGRDRKRLAKAAWRRMEDDIAQLAESGADDEILKSEIKEASDLQSPLGKHITRADLGNGRC